MPDKPIYFPSNFNHIPEIRSGNLTRENLEEYFTPLKKVLNADQINKCIFQEVYTELDNPEKIPSGFYFWEDKSRRIHFLQSCHNEDASQINYFYELNICRENDKSAIWIFDIKKKFRSDAFAIKILSANPCSLSDQEKGDNLSIRHGNNNYPFNLPLAPLDASAFQFWNQFHGQFISGAIKNFCAAFERELLERKFSKLVNLGIQGLFQPKKVNHKENVPNESGPKEIAETTNESSRFSFTSFLAVHSFNDPRSLVEVFNFLDPETRKRVYRS